MVKKEGLVGLIDGFEVVAEVEGDAAPDGVCQVL